MHILQCMVAHNPVHSEVTVFDIMHIHAILPLTKTLNQKRFQMAEQLDPNEMVRMKDLVVANSIQVDAMAMLLIEKGLITKDELFTMLKKVQMEYQSKHDA